MSKKVNLDVLSEEQVTRLRENTISRGMNSLKSKIREMDIKLESTNTPAHTEDQYQNYTGQDLAEVAVSVYRANIKPPVEDQEVPDEPDTHAKRVEKASLQRALMGLRNGGNSGKVSPVGPNGNGNLGKPSPTGDNGTGNCGTNTVSGNYYALTTDMTLEEYEAYIADKFQMDEGALAAIPAMAGQVAMAVGKAAKGTAKAVGKGAKKTVETVGKGVKKAGEATANASSAGGDLGISSDGGASINGPTVSESKQEVVSELEQRLLRLEDTSWVSIDKVMRVLAKENYMTPKELHKAFKSVHGMIPDRWLEEHQMVEDCGFIPLQEMDRMNPPGIIYEVSFLFRGGTQRYKFLYPSMERPSQEDMEQEVRKFWPNAKVMAYYPAPRDNEANLNGECNYMVAVPPVSENYNFIAADEWIDLSEEDDAILEQIFEEEGEPVGPPFIYTDGMISITISDHDTGEEREVFFEKAECDKCGRKKAYDAKCPCDKMNESRGYPGEDGMRDFRQERGGVDGNVRRQDFRNPPKGAKGSGKQKSDDEVKAQHDKAMKMVRDKYEKQYGKGALKEDDDWIQDATKNMRKDKPCTGDKFGSDTCPPGSKRYNLAKTFKKMAKNK